MVLRQVPEVSEYLDLISLADYARCFPAVNRRFRTHMILIRPPLCGQNQTRDKHRYGQFATSP